MGNYYHKKVTTVDETGEIVGEKSVTFFHPFQDGRGYRFRYKSTTIKSYLDSELPECFTDIECGRIYRLSKRIYSDSNLLAKRKENEIYPLSRHDVQELTGMHRNKFNPFWKKILENKVIKPVILGGAEYFCFNPLYYNTTTYLPLYIYTAFQDELKEMLPEWVIQRYLDMKEKEKQPDT